MPSLLKRSTTIPTSQCRAKDPSTCAYHGTAANAVTAESMHQSYVASKQKNETVRSSNNVVGDAIESTLTWEGKKPKWWGTYEKEVASHKELGSTPEILDVIDSPVGPLAVVWQNESIAGNDIGVSLGSGYHVNVCSYFSYETGEKLGYVKMASLSKESVERTFGNDEFTPFRWQDRYGGSGYPLDDGGGIEVYGDRNLSEAEKVELRKKIWLAGKKDSDIHGGYGGESFTDADGKIIASYNLNASHIPDDETVKKDLARFSKKIRKGMKDDMKTHEIPSVDFSRVEEPLKNKGFGAALYIYTAKKLGTQGKLLRGSGIQSDSAQGLWGKFSKKLPENVSAVDIPYRGKTSTYPVLDFRK